MLKRNWNNKFGLLQIDKNKQLMLQINKSINNKSRFRDNSIIESPSMLIDSNMNESTIAFDSIENLNKRKPRYNSVIRSYARSPLDKIEQDEPKLKYGKGHKMSKKMIKINSKLKAIYSENMQKSKFSYFRNSSVPLRYQNVNFPWSPKIKNLKKNSIKHSIEVSSHENLDINSIKKFDLQSRRDSDRGNPIQEPITATNFFPKVSSVKNSTLINNLQKQPFLVGDSAFINLDQSKQFNKETKNRKSNVSVVNKVRKKQSNVGLFSDLNSKNPVYDIGVYIRVLNQELIKMNNTFLQEKHKAYLNMKKKRSIQKRSIQK